MLTNTKKELFDQCQEMMANMVKMADKTEERLSEFRDILESYEERVTALEANSIARSEELIVLRKAVANVGEHSYERHKKIPESKAFDGSRNAKELENFIFDMEEYFKATHIKESDQVTISTMYLSGDAKLWWRSRKHEDASAGRPAIVTWEDLKKELREQFLPLNASWVARRALKKLKHTGAVRDYVKEFTSLMLDIKNMSEEDKVFSFIDGLQPWAQAELNRHHIKDLPSAVSIAEGLVDYKFSSLVSSSDKRKGTEKKTGYQKAKSYGQKGEASKQVKGPDRAKKPISCFICDGPHFARDCPRKLTALVATDKDEKKTDQTPSRVNPLRMLNALSAMMVQKQPKFHGLMYLTIEVNGKQVKAMLDTGATNNFVDGTVVDRLGLSVERSTSQVKSINTKVRDILGTTSGVVKIREWEDEVPFLCMPLDDFQVVSETPWLG